MIGDVVGRPDEIIEREDQRPVTRMNDPRRDRKILVAVGLSGSQVARTGHQELATFIGIGGMRRCLAHARISRAPYRGIRRQNQCYMGLSAASVAPAIEPKMGPPQG